MALALKPPRQHGKRMRLRFDDDVDLRGAEVLRRMLLVLPPGLVRVADLAGLVHSRLADSAVPLRHLMFSVDGFALPLEEQLHHVLRDDDVVTVREAQSPNERASVSGESEVGGCSGAGSPEPGAERPGSGAEGGCRANNAMFAALDAALSGARQQDGATRAAGGGDAGSPGPAAEHAPVVSSAEAASEARAALELHRSQGRPGKKARRASDPCAESGVGPTSASQGAKSLEIAKAIALAQADQAIAVAQALEGQHGAPETSDRRAGPPADGGSGGDKDHPNANKVFVSNFPREVEEAVLRKDFSECGKIVDFAFPRDRETGQSRCMAFITFEDSSGFQAALKYDGDDYAGRPLRVKVAESRGEGKSKGGKSKGGKSKGGKGKRKSHD